jgi:hypothetical protein
MELGLVIDPRLDRSSEEALDTVVCHGLTVVEPCMGGHTPTVCFDPVHLNRNAEAREEFRSGWRFSGESKAACERGVDEQGPPGWLPERPSRLTERRAPR